MSRTTLAIVLLALAAVVATAVWFVSRQRGGHRTTVGPFALFDHATSLCDSLSDGEHGRWRSCEIRDLPGESAECRADVQAYRDSSGTHARDVALTTWGCSDDTNVRLAREFLLPFIAESMRGRAEQIALAPPHDLRGLRSQRVIKLEEPLGEILLLLEWKPAHAGTPLAFSAMVLPSGATRPARVIVDPL